MAGTNCDARDRHGPALRRHAVLVAAAALLAAVVCFPAELPGRPESVQAVTSKPYPVPDPSALAAGWWDFVDPEAAGFDERAAKLLDEASRASATLPAPETGEAAAALERLRASLRTLPGMLQVHPSRPQPEPAVAATFTTTEFLHLDRRIRDLQADLDERRAAREISLRALRDAQRHLNAGFADYLTLKQPARRTLAGLQLMAERAQIAVAEGEERIRAAESERLAEELRGLLEIRQSALERIVPDPERSPEQLQALIAKAEDKVNEQRAEVLRLQVQRTSVVGDLRASVSEAEFADQRIVAAMVEQGYLSTRLALFKTEADWLSVTARPITTMTVSAIEKQLANRATDMNALDSNARDWLTATEHALATSLRAPAAAPASGPSRIREERIELAQQTITRIDQLRSVLTDVRLGMDVTLQLVADRSGWRGWLWTRLLNPTIKLAEHADDILSASLFKIGDTPVTSYGLVRIGLILLAAVLLSRIIQFLLGRLGARDRNRSSAGLYAVGRLLHYLLIAAAMLIGLSSIGLDFSQLALVAGALSIGIGFGLQSVVNNFVSGLIILFERNLKIGDVVQLDANTTGVIREINVRSTLINTSDNVDIVVPNAEFISSKVVNFTLRDPFHRIHVPFGVAYGTDKDLVRRVVIAAARKVPFTLSSEKNRDPDVWLVRLGASSLEFELVVWINPAAVSRPGAVVASYVWEIEEALRENGIEIPLPGRNVRLRLDPAELRAALRDPTGTP